MTDATDPDFSPLFRMFLELLKREEGRDIPPKEAVFHRDYAKYRHLLFPDDDAQRQISEFLTPTWINIILTAGMTDDLRDILFPGIYDLGNRSKGSHQASSVADLLREINCEAASASRRTDNQKGDKLENKTTRDLETVVHGLERTLQPSVFETSPKFTVGTLKTIKLLYRLTKERKSHLFGLIEHPIASGNPSLEYEDVPRQKNPTEDSLLVADLISYLSIGIDEERLVRIHKQLLTSNTLLECIVAENNWILAPIKDACREYDQPLDKAYRSLTNAIESYRHPPDDGATLPTGEALYTYLRSLKFHHFVGEYQVVYEESKICGPVNSINSEMDRLCLDLTTELGSVVLRDTPIVSIEDFTNFVQERSLSIRKLMKLILSFETRAEALADICSHAAKVLSMYGFHVFRAQATDAAFVSISDCVAALCAIRLEQHEPTSHEPRRFGDKSKGTNVLRHLNTKRPVQDVLDDGYVPHGTSQIIYLRFCEVHGRIADNMERYSAFMEFQIARLKKYAECYSTNNIDTMIRRSSNFDRWCFHSAELVVQEVQQHKLHEKIAAWINAGRKASDLQ